MDSPSKIRTSAKMCLREICDQAVSMGAECAKGNASFSNACGHLIIYQGDRPIGFGLKLLNRDLPTGVGLQMCVELIVLLHAGFARRACQDTGTEFLKVHTYPVEGEIAAAVRTFNSRQCWP
jgi:hypothetical protein